MRYPVDITCAADGCTVTFPDIPEAITCGSTAEEALKNAEDALETALDFYFEDRRAVPAPSKVKRGQAAVRLAPSVEAKVLLLNEMVTQQVRPTELARRMSVPKQEVHRILDPRHATKIDTISSALDVLGRTLELQLSR